MYQVPCSVAFKFIFKDGLINTKYLWYKKRKMEEMRKFIEQPGSSIFNWIPLEPVLLPCSMRFRKLRFSMFRETITRPVRFNYKQCLQFHDWWTIARRENWQGSLIFPSTSSLKAVPRGQERRTAVHFLFFHSFFFPPPRWLDVRFKHDKTAFNGYYHGTPRASEVVPPPQTDGFQRT